MSECDVLSSFLVERAEYTVSNAESEGEFESILNFKPLDMKINDSLLVNLRETFKAESFKTPSKKTLPVTNTFYLKEHNPRILGTLEKDTACLVCEVHDQMYKMPWQLQWNYKENV
jgi:hypothetical protein